MKRFKWLCKCENCGYEKAEVDGGKILTVQPPKYNYKCPKCGHFGYVLTGEARVEEVEEKVVVPKPAINYEFEDPINRTTSGDVVTIIQPQSVKTYTHCLICGEPVEVDMYSVGIRVCEECKEAIKILKKDIKERKNNGKQRRISEMRKNSR